jgi:hypothetical protein
MIKVALPLVAWIYAAVFLVTSIASGLLAHLITDEIERQLPIDQRPSWRLLRARDHPLKEVRLHARMYPDRRGLRWWWILTTVATFILLLGGAVAIVVS